MEKTLIGSKEKPLSFMNFVLWLSGTRPFENPKGEVKEYPENIKSVFSEKTLWTITYSRKLQEWPPEECTVVLELDPNDFIDPKESNKHPSTVIIDIAVKKLSASFGITVINKEWRIVAIDDENHTSERILLGCYYEDHEIDHQ